MKAAFLTSSLIAAKGKAAPASPRLTPKNLLDDDKKESENRVSRIYDRVREYAEPHSTDATEDEPQYATSEAREETSNINPENTDNPFLAEDTDTPDEALTRHNDTASYPQTEASHLPVTRDYQPVAASNPISSGYSSGITPSPLGEKQAREIAAEVSKLKKDGLGRIRISVRMSPRDHLQLKLIAAHTQMSAQSIFETALEEYVANHGTEILPQSCNCVLDKSSF